MKTNMAIKIIVLFITLFQIFFFTNISMAGYSQEINITKEKLGIENYDSSHVGLSDNKVDQQDIDKILTVSSLMREIFVNGLKDKFYADEIVIDGNHPIIIGIIDPNIKNKDTVTFKHDGNVIDVKYSAISYNNIRAETLNKRPPGHKLGQLYTITNARFGMVGGKLKLGCKFIIKKTEVEFVTGEIVFNNSTGKATFMNNTKCNIDNKNYIFQGNSWQLVH